MSLTAIRSRGGKSLFEIVRYIFGRFDADGEADQVVMDAEAMAVLDCQLAV